MILKALLERQFHTQHGGYALIPIVDAPAVAMAKAAGVGARLGSSSSSPNQPLLELGGSLDPGRFTPLLLGEGGEGGEDGFGDVDGVGPLVVSLHEGTFTYENGTTGYAGDVAVLRFDGGSDSSSSSGGGGGGAIDLLVVSQSAYFVGQACFTSFGLQPADYDVVVVKSPNGFRPHYEAIAESIIPVDVPGSTSANLLSLPFVNLQRPIFPLDRDARPLALLGLEVAETTANL
eukprot:COSAG06_NODE_11452_length_1506_cov_2.224591_1_plen_233_part_00